MNGVDNLISQIFENNTIPSGDGIILLATASTLAGFLLINELLDEHPHFFSSNIVKKIILWSFVYTQTNSISRASIYSIIIVFLFPRVFFGKRTGVKIKKKEDDRKLDILWEEKTKLQPGILIH